jgi:hypothetical protein
MLDPGRCARGCIEALEAIVAYDASWRLSPPNFRRDIVFAYMVPVSHSASRD